MALTQITTDGIKDGTITGTDLATNIDLVDNQKLRLGTNNEFEIFHDGTNSIIKESTSSGSLMILGEAILLKRSNGNEVFIDCHPNGNVELYYDNSKKFETTANGIAVSNISNNFGLDLNGVSNNTCIRFMSTGSSPNRGYRINFHSSTNVFNAPALTFDRTATDGTFSAHLAGISDDGFHLPDNLKLHLGSTGASGDLQIYHDGTHSYLQDSGTGNLKVLSSQFNINNAANSEAIANFIENGAVELFHDGSKKFETTSTGVKLPISSGGDGMEFFNSGNIYPEIVGNMNRTLSDKFLISLAGKWNNNHVVGKIAIETGDDTTNKDDGRITFFTAQSGGNIAERLEIEPNGNVRIPADNARLQIGASQDLQIYHDGSNSYINDTGTGSLILDGNSIIRLRLNGTTKFQTDSSGVIASGTEHTFTSGTSGDCKLVIEADTDNSDEADNPLIVFRQDGGIEESAIGMGFTSTSSDNILTLANSVTNGAITFATGTTNGYTNAVERMRIDTSGNVGIGTTPNKPLHIFRASNDAEIRLQTNSGTERNSYISLRESNGDLDFYTVTASNMKFHTSNTERMRITSDGNTVFKDKDSGHTGGGFYSRTKTVTLSGDNTTSFMRFSLDHGALAAMVYLTGSNNGSSISRVYAVSCQFGDNDPQSIAYAGGYGSNGLELLVSTSSSSHTFQVRVSGGTQEVNMTVHLGNANQNVTYTEL